MEEAALLPPLTRGGDEGEVEEVGWGVGVEGRDHVRAESDLGPLLWVFIYYCTKSISLEPKGLFFRRKLWRKFKVMRKVFDYEKMLGWLGGENG